MSLFWKILAWTEGAVIVLVMNYYGIKLLGWEIIGSGVFSISFFVAWVVGVFTVKIGSAWENYFEANTFKEKSFLAYFERLWLVFKRGSWGFLQFVGIMLLILFPLILAFIYWAIIQSVFNLSYEAAGGATMITIIVIIAVIAAIWKITDFSLKKFK